jgi:hypothetical protein
MTEINAIQLKEQLRQLGFADAVSWPDAYRNSNELQFSIHHYRESGKDQLMYSLYYDTNAKDQVELKLYELTVRSIPIPEKLAELDRRMQQANKIYNNYLNGIHIDKADQFLKNIENDLEKLANTDKAAADLLRFKHHPEIEYRKHIADDYILKQQYEKTLTVAVSDGDVLTATQAYKLLKQMEREHVIDDQLLDIASREIARGNIYIAYNTITYFLDKPDMEFFKTKDEANEYADNNISEYDNYNVIRAASVDELLKQIPYGQQLDQQLSNYKNLSIMNEKNFDYLSNQLKYTGFGEDLQQLLKEKLQKQEPEFTLSFQKDYGKDETAATLHFRKPEDSDMYFFNRYNLMLKSDQHPDTIKQTFYISNKEDNITLKEAYNLMSGRAIFKEKVNKEGEKYTAWQQLNFKETDAHGNFKLRPFNENYGFDLKAVLQNHPIKELLNETDSQRLFESLERGNRQSVTLTIQGKEQKVFIEAAPQFKSLNFYEASGQRIRTDKLYESNSAGQSVKQDDQKKSLKQNPSDDEGGPPRAKKKTNRKRQGIN